MDVVKLALKWDGVRELRDRVRKDRKMNVHPLTQKWCEPTRANCISNSSVLIPCLERLAVADQWKLPYLEPLQAEISCFHERVGAPLEEKVIYTTSVEIKKMLGFIKRKAMRKEVTKDCQPEK